MPSRGRGFAHRYIKERFCDPMDINLCPLSVQMGFDNDYTRIYIEVGLIGELVKHKYEKDNPNTQKGD